MKYHKSSPVIFPSQLDALRNQAGPARHDGPLDQPALQLATHADSPPVTALPPVIQALGVEVPQEQRILPPRIVH